MTCASRGSSAENSMRHVAELPLERGLLRIDAGQVIVGEAKQHAGDVGGIFDEDDEIDERDRVERLPGIQTYPALVGWIHDS